MADSSSESFLRRHWEEYKAFWSERFSFLDNYSRFVQRDKPLSPWSDADVEQFIASDPIYGPILKTAREAAKFAAVGSAIGAASTAAFAWKYSRSPHEEDTYGEDYREFGKDYGELYRTLILANMRSAIHLLTKTRCQGAALSLGAGAVFGWTFGHEIANHWLQLYRLDTMSSQVKFLEWWEKKSLDQD